MSEFIAALPMYDWPEIRAGVDAQWARLREALRARGIDAPQALVRRNDELPPVPGGICDGEGRPAVADPATLPPDELDFMALWLHPALLFCQTCWGPLELGLKEHVQVIGQPDYSDCEGGEGAFYSSALIMGIDAPGVGGAVPAPAGREAVIPLDLMRGRRLAFNGTDSMSGFLALARDLEALGESLAVFSQRIETGAHRASARAVAQGEADVAAIDCRSWNLFKRFEPDVAARIQVVGWTGRRKGLPFVTARTTPAETVDMLRAALAASC